MNDKEITYRQVLNYEVRSSLWAQYIRSEWLQEIAALYFSWKVSRKYKKYIQANELEKRVKNSTQTQE